MTWFSRRDKWSKNIKQTQFSVLSLCVLLPYVVVIVVAMASAFSQFIEWHFEFLFLYSGLADWMPEKRAQIQLTMTGPSKTFYFAIISSTYAKVSFFLFLSVSFFSLSVASQLIQFYLFYWQCNWRKKWLFSPYYVCPCQMNATIAIYSNDKINEREWKANRRQSKEYFETKMKYSSFSLVLYRHWARINFYWWHSCTNCLYMYACVIIVHWSKSKSV